MENNNQIVELYMQGASTTEIASYFNIHRMKVQRILLKNNVSLRRVTSQIKCNKQFFYSYTPQSCYWAGFVLADGYIRGNRNSLSIKLCKKDKTHLYNFLNAIECTEFSRVKDADTYSHLTISLDMFKDGLEKLFGITNNKTFTAAISDKIPEKYLKYFILGYFDGDGCLTKSNGVPSINFVGTTDTLDVIKSYFYNIIGVRLKSKNKIPPIQYKTQNIGSIHYSGKNAHKILSYLYEGLMDNCYLERKHDRYKLYFN
jgi:hypothetical protein